MSYLGIDLGTSSVKVVIADASGTVLGEASVPYPTHHPMPGAAEQDPRDWWKATVEAVRALDVQAGSITAIGMTGQMHGLVCLNAADEVIRPAIIWADTRGATTARELTSLIGDAQLADLVGSALASGFLGTSVAWMRQHERHSWRSIATVLLPKDYIRFRLTGEKATDPSDAASTGLLNVHDRDWSDPMLEAVGLDRSRAPEIRGSAAVAGELTAEAAVELNLPAGIPVVCGGGDAPVAALACGVADGRSLLATLSSGAQVIVFS